MDDTPSRLCPRRRCAAAGEGKPGCGRKGRGRIRDDRCSAASPPLWLRRKRANASRGRMTGRQDFFGKPARVPSCALPNAVAPFMPAFIAASRRKLGREALWELTSPVRFGIIINILERKGTSRVHRLRLSVVGTPAFDGGLQAAVSLARTTRRPELGNAASASLRAKIYTIRAAECLEGILR